MDNVSYTVLGNSMTFSLEDNLFSDYHLEAWQMGFDQRLAFIGLLERVQPELSVEVGTFKAGSLSAIAKYSEQVYSLDIDPKLPAKYGEMFPNVDFLTGKSQDVLPQLLKDITRQQRKLEFILVDGDHSEMSVRQDCNSVLAYEPLKTLYIVFHDTFNPSVRRGILGADWADNPYVRELHLDFVPGIFHEERGEMWGGLGLAVMTATPREGDLKVIERCHQVHDVMLRRSTHFREQQGIHKIIAGIRRYMRR